MLVVALRGSLFFFTPGLVPSAATMMFAMAMSGLFS